MDTTTVSSRFQVVIPLGVRRAVGIRPGRKIQVIPYEGRIELIPIRPLKQAKGFLRGLDTTVEREQDCL
jgi:AbrB family looped-hinge helix DNA binding protein